MTDITPTLTSNSLQFTPVAETISVSAETRRTQRKGGLQMRSIPLSNARVGANSVWRDALGPGYAVGAAESLLRVTGDAAARPYRTSR